MPPRAPVCGGSWTRCGPAIRGHLAECPVDGREPDLIAAVDAFGVDGQESGGPELRPSMPLPRRVGKLVVHVLGSTVGLAGQPTCVDADDREEAVDPESHQDRYDDVDPPHVDHHFSCTSCTFPWAEAKHVGARAVVNCGLTVARPEARLETRAANLTIYQQDGREPETRTVEGAALRGHRTEDEASPQAPESLRPRPT
jgi:hypothetical protein